MQALTGPGVE